MCDVQVVNTGVSDQLGIPVIGGTCMTSTSPYCQAEYWLTLSMMYVSFFFQAFFTSKLLSLCVEASLSRKQFKEELRTTNEYMRFKGLGPDLRERVREFYLLRHSGGKVGWCDAPRAAAAA